jgi:hypothetical protein
MCQEAAEETRQHAHGQEEAGLQAIHRDPSGGRPPPGTMT